MAGFSFSDFTGGFKPTYRPAKSPKPRSSRFAPNRGLDVRGRDRVISRTATNTPTVRTAAINRSASSVSSSSSRSSIRDLQKRLNAAGASLKVDGIMGPRTRAAKAKYLSGSSSPNTGASSGSSGGGSSGGSSGGGSGGGGGATTAPEHAATKTKDKSDLATLRADRLAAALKAIATQFQFEEGKLSAGRSQLQNEFDTTKAQQDRQNPLNIEAIGNAAAERGIFQSGINAQATGDEFARQAEERSNLIGSLGYEEGNEGLQIRNIMSAIALLGQQQASAEGQAKLGAEKDELDIAQLVALVGAGLQ